MRLHRGQNDEYFKKKALKGSESLEG